MLWHQWCSCFHSYLDLSSPTLIRLLYISECFYLCSILYHHTCCFVNINVLYLTSYSIYLRLNHIWDFTMFAHQQGEDRGGEELVELFNTTPRTRQPPFSSVRSEWKTAELPDVQGSPWLTHCTSIGYFCRTILLDQRLPTVPCILGFNLMSHLRRIHFFL